MSDFDCWGNAQGSNPVYNLLPDILSSLSAEPGLASGDFQGIMRTLLAYIGKDRQADALADKLLLRFDGPTPLSRNLAFCLGQVCPTSSPFYALAVFLPVNGLGFENSICLQY